MFVQQNPLTLPDADGNDTTEDYLVMSRDRVDVAHLESLRDGLHCVEPILPELDRGTRVLRPTGRHQADAFNLPDEFYTRSIGDLKAEYEQRLRNLEGSLQLRTKEMREREEQREKRKYRYTVLRIRFPSQRGEQLIVQATFAAHERVQALVDYLHDDVLSDTWRSRAWTLFEPATRRSIACGSAAAASGDAKELLDSRLYDVHLVPAAIVAFRPVSPAGESEEYYLKSELMARAEEL